MISFAHTELSAIVVQNSASARVIKGRKEGRKEGRKDLLGASMPSHVAEMSV